jgi:hypothetical protein
MVMASRKSFSTAEQRYHARHAAMLAGKLFIPARQTELQCSVVDLSASGASVVCENPHGREIAAVLYIEGLGRFEAVTVRYVKGTLGLRFICSERKRCKLQAAMAQYLEEGRIEPTTTRKHRRVAVTPSIAVMRSNGQQLNCEVLDISLQGLSLKTHIRPRLNEVMRVGRSYARVARHHDVGIGVEFVTSDPQL